MARFSQRALVFEQLERKQMLAGDVVVSLLGGNLFIRGDESGNQIAISSGEEPGTYVIQGRDGTTVHLADSDEPAPQTGLVVEGVRGQVTVNLGAGNDTLNVSDAHFRRGLSVNMGEGEDTVRIGAPNDVPNPGDAAADVTIRGSLLIRTGSENDTVEIGSVSVGGLIGVSTDGGDDSVQLGGPDTSEGVVAGDEAPAAVLHARAGITVALGDGADTATVESAATRGGVAIGGGEGADQISLTGVRSFALGIRGGPGDAGDQIDLTNVHSRLAGIATAAGADRVAITDSAFTALVVSLGAGNDSLALDTVRSRFAALAGGEGDGDEISRTGENEFGTLVVTGFEIPADANTPRPTDRPPLGSRLTDIVRRLRGRG